MTNNMEARFRTYNVVDRKKTRPQDDPGVESKRMTRNKLEAITLRGFKTFAQLENFKLQPLTVLIGPNGAGKSNFISFFRMLSWALGEPNGLPYHVGERGGASTFLHYGPATCREIEAELTIRTERDIDEYWFRLVWAAGDTFIFADEQYRFSRSDFATEASWQETGAAGRRFPQILALAEQGNDTARIIRRILQKLVVYQFHNTSQTARLHTKWHMDDNRWLKEDAGNLAPFLLRLREQDGRCYQRIVDTLRLILPYFADFELEPQGDYLLLNWRERNSDQVFSVSQASDGMLRVVALVALLLQPIEDLPDVLILDEPELGLHPYAINVVGGLIQAVSDQIQVIVATQSTTFVDCFDPTDIVVVERADRSSSFKRQNPEELSEWLEEYSLSELWEKNVLGGRP